MFVAKPSLTDIILFKEETVMIKMLIIEDQKIVRDALINSLNDSDEISVVADSGDASESLSMCEKYSPDLVLMDICTEHDSSGIEAAGHIKTRLPQIKVVLMTGVPEISFIEKAKAANVDSFIYKNIGIDDMIHILISTMNGYGTFPNENRSDDVKIMSELTEREMQVLRLLCDAKNRTEISKELSISESSVKTYISSLLSKTGFENTSKLAIYAVRNGLINPKI